MTSYGRSNKTSRERFRLRTPLKQFGHFRRSRVSHRRGTGPGESRHRVGGVGTEGRAEGKGGRSKREGSVWDERMGGFQGGKIGTRGGRGGKDRRTNREKKGRRRRPKPLTETRQWRLPVPVHEPREQPTWARLELNLTGSYVALSPTRTKRVPSLHPFPTYHIGSTTRPSSSTSSHTPLPPDAS